MTEKYEILPISIKRPQVIEVSVVAYILKRLEVFLFDCGTCNVIDGMLYCTLTEGHTYTKSRSSHSTEQDKQKHSKCTKFRKQTIRKTVLLYGS